MNVYEYQSSGSFSNLDIACPSTLQWTFYLNSLTRFGLNFIRPPPPPPPPPPSNKRTNVCSNGLGLMIKMAAMPKYNKQNLKIFYSRTAVPIAMKLSKAS